MVNRIELLRDLLQSFNVGITDIQEVKGKTLTLYEVRPALGVRVAKIRSLVDDIAIGLGVTKVRVIAPMENGKVGIEVPNQAREIIPVSDIFNTWNFENADMELPIALGKTVTNDVLIADLAEMPHLLVAGATGQGKSVCLNVIIASLLRKLSPNDLKLVLIDPKQVEFSIYEAIEKPYLAHLKDYKPICIEPNEARDTIDSLIGLMELRYSMLKEKKVRNIKEYNKIAEEKLPYYVIIIDEYGDLILQSSKYMEVSICRIAQKARAIGIHLIIATQRPDTKIITGTIKANFPTRIAFRTTTGTDSRVILDQTGAEKLTGKGDMLFFQGAELIRCQCAYISTEEVAKMCDEIKVENEECVGTMLPSEVKFAFPDVKQVLTTKCWIEKLRPVALALVGKRYVVKLSYPNGPFCEGAAYNIFYNLGIIGEWQRFKSDYSTCDVKAFSVLVNSEEEVNRILDSHINDDIDTLLKAESVKHAYLYGL
ncbi:MAG: DUF87 domain-containing protein [Bacteroidaceae bacterium]|nr:DUF87 domain-containing protein [Bacteroidaceae bacterium]